MIIPTIIYPVPRLVVPHSGPPRSLGNTLYFLTNFSFLCREGAIGCTAFKDTFNTVSDTGPRAYNVRLSGATGTKVTAKVGNDSYTCQIEQGKTSCFVNIKGHTKAEIEAATGAKAEFVNSTYFIPSDTPDNNPIYLVANQAASCGESDLGCTAAGLQKSTPSGNKFETVNIKLDPNQFEAGVDASGNPQVGILCQKDAVGCVEYSSSQGSSYFKDPAVTGAKICTYKTVTLDNAKVEGWFWNGVGTCANNAKKNCSVAEDCTVGAVTSIVKILILLLATLTISKMVTIMVSGLMVIKVNIIILSVNVRSRKILALNLLTMPTMTSLIIS